MSLNKVELDLCSGTADFLVMPNYDYKCETCERVFEVFQKMTDDKLITCIFDDCEGKVKRLLGTGAGVLFKGTGFYETDYRSKSYSDGASKEKPSAGDKPAGKKDSE